MQGKQRGRPPLEPGKAKRASFNTRLRPSLKVELETAAKQEGRSLSEEIEFRLERSLEDQVQIAAAISVGMEIGSKMLCTLQKLSADAQKQGQFIEHRHGPPVLAAGNLVQLVIDAGALSRATSYERLRKRFPQLVSALERLEKEISAFDSAGTTARKVAQNERNKRSQPRPPRRRKQERVPHKGD